MTQIFLILHILAGFAALGAAGVALGSAKGRVLHRKSGTVYTVSMALVALSALALVAIRPNPFLLVIGVFSAWLVFTGWRAAVLSDGRPRALDHVAGAIMALTGLAMLGMGAAGLLRAPAAQPVVLLVFGSVGLTLALADWRDWRAAEAVTANRRIARHLTRMLAATSATITAAVVVNLTFLPALVSWLAPTALLTPLIFWWNARILRSASCV